MIDCKKTKNYFQERKRMCERDGCNGCPLCSYLNDTNKTCPVFENDHPNEAIRIVQDWSNANPPRTIMTELLEKYPKASIKDGVPDFCPSVLGLTPYCNGNYQSTSQACIDCWSKLVKESEVK